MEKFKWFLLEILAFENIFLGKTEWMPLDFSFKKLK